MRPTRLELDGFASFRTPTAVDFTDADLFVLSGPTGAGKSSVIDAMVFALYGVVPRYDDRRRVAPVISQGRNEARVRFDFTVDGRAYTAVRVVRRTKTGATTKEARLERWRGDDPGDTVVEAGTADELSARVEALLGLSFDHFTTCVVLPQGTFQEFLHAKPGDRQDLLVELLDLDVYRKVGQAARERARTAQQTADMLQRRLDADFASATQEARERADARVADLEQLLAAIGAHDEQLATLEAEGQDQRARAERARSRAKLLADIAPPEDAGAMTGAVTAARGALQEAEAAAETAAEAADRAQRVRDEAGEPAPLLEQRSRLAQHAEVAAQLPAAREQAETCDTDLDAARARHDDAAAALEAAREALEAAHRRDLAATLAAGLHRGDDCPVCLRPLDEDPQHAPSEDVARAEAAVAEARSAVQHAEQARRDAERARTEAHTRVTALAGREQEVAAAIAAAEQQGVPAGTDELQRALDRLECLDREAKQARQREREAHQRRREAAEALRSAEAAIADAWKDFDRTWSQVAELQPPAVPREDLAAAWAGLTEWARATFPELESDAQQAEAAVAATRERYQQILDTMMAAAREHDVVPERRTRDAVRDACVSARERARGEAERIRALLSEAAEVRGQQAAAEQARRVAAALGQHLDAKRFERWLMNRALKRLVTGATRILRELSDGAYSLTLDDHGAFLVVDHRNADEARSARTLSGGETFLASLSLALALSEHVADLAAQGAARLECLVLDEGFGTLDADTLDVVASSLEELGSHGRMVGIITHVPTLAERLPVRYDVRKVAGSSTIERRP